MNTLVLPNEIVFESALEYLQQGRPVTLLLVGRSMEPTLRNQRDKVTLSPIPSDYVFHKGDVVLFHATKGYILHRIINIEGDHYTIQGDNCVSCEHVQRTDICALLTEVTHKNGSVLHCNSTQWKRKSRYASLRKSVRITLYRCFNRQQRRWQRSLFFVLLAILMWTPLNGLGVPLNNFVLGIRLDHLLHASVYLLCAFYLMDFKRLKVGYIWLIAIAIGIVTESVQYLLPYRGFDINDMVANFLGASLGWLALLRPMRRSRAKL